jgi:hypothetical protein
MALGPTFEVEIRISDTQYTLAQKTARTESLHQVVELLANSDTTNSRTDSSTHILGGSGV